MHPYNMLSVGGLLKRGAVCTIVTGRDAVQAFSKANTNKMSK